MPRKKWIDKKSATHFTLVHRPQNDPLIHDTSVSSMILNPIVLPNSNKIKKLNDLESELGLEVEQRRENEGEAANYGIYFDDTEYDYMQHMRDLGGNSGESYFIEASLIKNEDKNKGKVKQSLENALKNTSLEDRAQVLLDEEILPPKNLRKATYQSQQDIPDALTGFQPDMDLRLREVLEALEDDAYVDEEEDIFEELAKDGEEIDQDEFEQAAWDDEDGWASDHTVKAETSFNEVTLPSANPNIDDDKNHNDGTWMENFSKFKKDQKFNKSPSGISALDLPSSVMTTTTNGGRRKKRKGALTNPSNYSMTSSSMFRNEGLTTLDARFEKIEEQYNMDLDDMASVSAVSSVKSSVCGPMRGDFDSIMDDFLGGYSMSGKKHVKKEKYKSGIEQLDEVRKGLGPAIIRSK